MSNVTPIRANGGGPAPPKPPRRRRQSAARPPGVRLRDSDEFDGYSTRDVINGLHGVCCTLDEAIGSQSCRDINYLADLSMAAKVLSSIVANRVDE